LAQAKPGEHLRKNLFGYDPARANYILAQEHAAKGSMDKSLMYLKKSLKWDISYGEKAVADPNFDRIKNFERFKALIEKYCQPKA
jgi:hypothetical protein